MIFLELLVQTLARLFRPWRGREILNHTAQMALGSLAIIGLATSFAGVVVAREFAWHMDHALHSVSMIPGFTGQFVIRELGIAIPALLLVAKVGASITAEVSTMTVTEQVEALRLIGVDPISYLVLPRFIACIVSSVCLTLISIFLTLICSMAVAIFEFGFSWMEYLNAVQHFVGGNDLACALVKSAVYGATIPIVSCYYGFGCKGGAEGVGSATTQSVVTSTLAIIAMDFGLTYLFAQIF